jgi:hypothetical protein
MRGVDAENSAAADLASRFGMASIMNCSHYHAASRGLCIRVGKRNRSPILEQTQSNARSSSTSCKFLHCKAMKIKQPLTQEE